MLIVCTVKGNGDNRRLAWGGGQDLYFHLRQRAVTPESRTLFAATGRISTVITRNPVIRRWFESGLAQEFNGSCKYVAVRVEVTSNPHWHYVLYKSVSARRPYSDTLQQCFPTRVPQKNRKEFRDKNTERINKNSEISRKIPNILRNTAGGFIQQFALLE